ncbi:disease resistance protein RGA2-like isoform X2 [Arachis stenosperma]|nr:disease resistance protein RGA2-like isoform X2 [Arachis stenosperma]XP_057718416.1 disease resistance protein RGA2-like isoform X2 [Arachis stenosperma]
MTDSLFCIADSLVAKLASHAFTEASRVLGVYKDLQDVNRTLSIVKALLLDAERRCRVDAAVREWLHQLQWIFNDAQDLMDEIEYAAIRKQVAKVHGSSTFVTKIGNLFSRSNPLIFRFKMTQRIKEVKGKLDKIAADRDRFGLHIVHDDNRVVHRKETRTTHSHVNASDVIGREKDKERIIELLMENGSKSVLSIVGVGGVGKTTVAKLVFNDVRIAQSFRLRIWVYVDQECGDSSKSKHVISKIIDFLNYSTSSFANALGNLDMEILKNQLKDKLANKKFLLVLDDAWFHDRIQWTELRDLIWLDAAKGSKILVTTRSRQTASIMSTISPHHFLDSLSEENSLCLFVKWAFREGAERRYPDLIEIAKDITKKCHGNPLALVTLASSLFGNVDKDKWISLRDSEIWQDENQLGFSAFDISYDQLPSYLKQCFALFALYPINYVFDSFHVASLWSALGLLPLESNNQILKHGPNQCLNELQSRSFLEDFVDYGTGSTFKLHGLVHDYAKSVARPYSHIINSSFGSRHRWIVRNASFLSNDVTTISATARTILFPIAGVGATSMDLLNALASRCKYLRFLDLSDSTYETLPQSIGNLKHLRYLSLENNKSFKKLPDSICRLHNLEVLILSGCAKLEALPKGLGNLISLRHLEITTNLHCLPEDDIARLSSLQTLRVESCKNLKSLFAKTRLPSLRVLVVSGCSSLRSLPLDIEHFPLLDTLVVDNCDKLELYRGT